MEGVELLYPQLLLRCQYQSCRMCFQCSCFDSKQCLSKPGECQFLSTLGHLEDKARSRLQVSSPGLLWEPPIYPVLSRRSYHLGSVICGAFSISNASLNEVWLVECETVLHAHGRSPINRTMLIFWLVTPFWLNYKYELVLRLDFNSSSNGYFRPSHTHLPPVPLHTMCSLWL